MKVKHMTRSNVTTIPYHSTKRRRVAFRSEELHRESGGILKKRRRKTQHTHSGTPEKKKAYSLEGERHTFCMIGSRECSLRKARKRDLVFGGGGKGAEGNRVKGEQRLAPSYGSVLVCKKR